MPNGIGGRWGLVLAFLAGTAAGLGLGVYGGVYFTLSHFGSEWLSAQAKDIHSRVVMLRHLRAGETAQAIELAEARLSDWLIAIQPDERITDRTVSDINKAIDESREYRKAHPRKSRTSADKMVENLFQQEPYK